MLVLPRVYWSVAPLPMLEHSLVWGAINGMISQNQWLCNPVVLLQSRIENLSLSPNLGREGSNASLKSKRRKKGKKKRKKACYVVYSEISFSVKKNILFVQTKNVFFEKQKEVRNQLYCHHSTRAILTTRTVMTCYYSAL